MLRRMDAEIIYLNPDHVSFGVAVLIEHDFAVEVLDWVDDYGPAVWVKAWANTELTDSEFFDLVERLVMPDGGVVEAGLMVDPPLSFRPGPPPAAYH